MTELNQLNWKKYLDPHYLSRAILGNLRVRRWMVFMWYVLGIVLCYYAAFVLRFDGRIEYRYWELWVDSLPFLLVARITVFYYFDLYSGIWRFISMKDVVQIVGAVLLSSCLFSLVYYHYHHGTFSPYPRSTIIIEAMLYILYCVGGRAMLRLIREMGMLDRTGRESAGNFWQDNSLILGDLLYVNSFLSSVNGDMSVRKSIVGVLCPLGEHHRGESIHGIKILGSPAEVGKIAHAVNATNLLLVDPYTSPNELKTISDDCAKESARVHLRMIPSLNDLVHEKLSVSAIRNVDIEDLLGRKPITFKNTKLAQFLTDRRVLITGAGGTIGSELARQILHYRPDKLILFDNGEFALYEIHRLLSENLHECDVLAPITGDIRLVRDLDWVFSHYQPEIVFHAAAYKHVPLMERNIPAAVRTNVVGTALVAAAAREHGVKKFILVSSDKAVRPSSIMGGTKRMAERVVLESAKSATEFIVVRFGNVIGSSGSVVPLFKDQIAKGGPITVTTPNVTRYFMTVSEAVDLLLQAGEIGKDREIMILEMGTPVNIDQLGRRLIKLSGFIPEVDIAVKYIGLRPGEKEFEELLTADENVVRSSYDKIWVLTKKTKPDELPPAIDLAHLEMLIDKNDDGKLKEMLMVYIPEHSFASPATG